MMTGRLTAVSGFLHGLFSSQSPVRASPKDEEAAMVLDDSKQPQAGPSSSTTLSQDLTVLDGANKENEADLYGIELDMSGAAPSGDTGRAITSSGFYGYPSQAGGTNKRKRCNFEDKGKGRAIDAPPAAPRLRNMSGVFQPVRTYKCPPVDQPLYTLDSVNWTITIHATDADPSYWPSKAHQRSTTAILNTSAPVSSGEAGEDVVLAKKTDWHEPVIQETSQYRSWKQKCGHTLAKLLGLEGELPLHISCFGRERP